MRSFGCGRLGLLILSTSIACLDSTAPIQRDTGNESNPAERVPLNLEVDPTTLTLDSGESRTITARVLDQFGVPFNQIPPTVVITWTVADPTVASATAGQVTARSPGFTTIKANAPGMGTATVHLGVVAIGTLVSRMQIAYPGDTPDRFTIAATFNPRTDGEPPREWADATYDQASSSWTIRATWRRDDGLRDVLEIIQVPTGNTPASGYLLATLWIGLNELGSEALAVYSADPDASAVQVSKMDGRRIEGHLAFDVFGGPPSGPDTFRVSGSFNVPFVKQHALPAP